MKLRTVVATSIVTLASLATWGRNGVLKPYFTNIAKSIKSEKYQSKALVKQEVNYIHPFRSAIKTVASAVLAWAALIGVACWLTGDVYIEAKLSTLGISSGIVDPPADRLARYGFTALFLGGATLTKTVWGWFITILMWITYVTALTNFITVINRSGKIALLSRVSRVAVNCIKSLSIRILEFIRAITPERAEKYRSALRIADISNSWALALIIPLLIVLVPFAVGSKQGKTEGQSILNDTDKCISSRRCQRICVGSGLIDGIIAFADKDKIIVARKGDIIVLPQSHPRFIGYRITKTTQKCTEPIHPAF